MAETRSGISADGAKELVEVPGGEDTEGKGECTIVSVAMETEEAAKKRMQQDLEDQKDCDEANGAKADSEVALQRNKHQRRS